MKSKIISVALMCLISVSCGKNEDKQEKEEIIRPVKTYAVPLLNEMVSRTYPGVTTPVNNANITFEVSGKLMELYVDVGKKVKKGELLAKLDIRDYKNALVKATSERNKTKAHYERIRNAAEANAVSKQDLTNAIAAFEAAEASLEIAKKALDDASIYAPFNGEIVSKYAEKFENISPKQEILRIVDDSKMEMTIDLPERMRLAISDVVEVWVVLDAYRDVKIPAKIINIGSEPSKTTGTYPITVRFEKLDKLRLIPGMVGEVGGFSRLGKEDFFASVPSLSLFKENEKIYVYKINPETKTLKKTEVTLFNRFPLDSNGVPVRGLKAGEIIVSAGVSSVREGMKVKVLNENDVKEGN